MFSCCRLTLVLGFTLGVVSPGSVSAQRAYRWSSDATVGGAIVSGGDFFNNGRAAAHLAVAGRLLPRAGGRFAAYAEVGYDWFGQFGLFGTNPDLVCIVTPGGGCEPSYPDVAGPSGTVGLLYAPVPSVESRIGVGGAAYSVDGTRIGAAIGQLDASVFPAGHLGLVLGARLAVIPRYRRDRLTLLPLLIGVRVR